MDWEHAAKAALRRIEDLERKIKDHETRLNKQYATTEDIIRRLTKLENTNKATQ